MERITVNQDILIMAFRYSLDRNTTAPWSVCLELKENWDKIYPEFKKQIVNDIHYKIKLSEGKHPYTKQISEDFREFLSWVESLEE